MMLLEENIIYEAHRGQVQLNNESVSVNYGWLDVSPQIKWTDIPILT